MNANGLWDFIRNARNSLQGTVRQNRPTFSGFSRRLQSCQFTALSTVLLCTFVSACNTLPDTHIPAINTNAEDLLSVDCLLPPQLRQLGPDATYLGPRRALRTTGAQCAMRGGEYVAYARADFKSALAVWMPQAMSGDPEAQTYVGEIHEKGLGTRASYELAASWYARAAKQHYSRAQINLGYLYESGLGVERDLVKALNLYRQASGFTAAELEFVSSVEVANRQATTLNNQRLTSQVQMLHDDIATNRRELVRRDTELQRKKEAIADLRATLAQSVRAQQPSSVESSTLSTTVERHDPDMLQKLDKQEKILGQQQTELDRLRDELMQRQASLPSPFINHIKENSPKAPVINIIDPPLLGTRSSSTLIASDISAIKLIGKVEPADNLFVLRINGNDLPVTTSGLFRYGLPANSKDNIDILAIDNQGASTRLSISIAQPEKAATLKKGDLSDANDTTTMPRVSFNRKDFGEYHALIVGNDAYDNMNNLKTAGHDATTVAQLLREQYGFNTRLLLNATQKDLLNAMEDMRQKLGPSDNLVIYYAGHGELDTQTGSGYWLPTDADSVSKEQWIANSALTAMIDLMKAKHVLVIADSCYSGTLTRSSVARALPDSSDALRLRWLKAVSRTRVRTVLSSGSVRPVLDESPDSRHSVFAEKLIDTLQRNTEPLEAYELFVRLQPAVTDAAAALNVEQTPQYAPLRHAGHQAGEFIFLPSGRLSVGATQSGK